jgi:hypothetical protein
MINKEEIIQTIKLIEKLLSLKSYNQLAILDKFELESTYYEVAISSYSGEVTFPHTDDYESIDFFLVQDFHIHTVYDLWINNQKSDLSLIIEIWRDAEEIVFGIIDIEVM